MLELSCFAFVVCSPSSALLSSPLSSSCCFLFALLSSSVLHRSLQSPSACSRRRCFLCALLHLLFSTLALFNLRRLRSCCLSSCSAGGFVFCPPALFFNLRWLPLLLFSLCSAFVFCSPGLLFLISVGPALVGFILLSPSQLDCTSLVPVHIPPRRFCTHVGGCLRISFSRHDTISLISFNSRRRFFRSHLFPVFGCTSPGPPSISFHIFLRHTNSFSISCLIFSRLSFLHLPLLCTTVHCSRLPTN